MKSKALVGMAQAVVELHDGEIPATMEALTALPGVGRKTANVVLGHALGVPGLPVDRHVLRVANRIGIARSDDPIVVEQQLTAALAPKDWTRASDTLILHGRRICKPRPLCDRCAVRAACEYYRKVIVPALKKSEKRARSAARGSKLAATSRAGSAARSSHARRNQPRRVCRKKHPCRRNQPRRVCRKKHPCRRNQPRREAEKMTRERFTRLVEEAVREIPRRFRTAMTNVAVVVEDEPSADLLEEMEVEAGDTLFGLYQGTPLTERSWGYGNTLPDRISIYQRPIEESCANDDEIRDCIAETVIHEFGHYFGMSEEQIEEIEEKFWRGESIEQA